MKKMLLKKICILKVTVINNFTFDYLTEHRLKSNTEISELFCAVFTKKSFIYF